MTRQENGNGKFKTKVVQLLTTSIE